MKKTIAILMIVLILLPTTYTYALEDSEFFEVEKTEITKTETLELTIDLEQIEYNNFIFLLTSNTSLENVETEQEIELSKESDEISIEINKEKTNLSKIILYYSIPSDLQVGDKILLTAKVENLENEEENETVEIEITIIEEQLESEESKQNEQEEISKSEEVVEEEQSQTWQEIENVQNFQSNESSSYVIEAEVNNRESSQEQQITETEESVDMQQEEEITYNGSSNNYLSELYVSNYELNKDFTKENSTYFITLDDDIDTIEIVANAEDSNAVVCIYGNEDLQEGTNKILISVTAENGSVRYYRIYANK